MIDAWSKSCYASSYRPFFHPEFQKLSSSNPSIPSQVWSVALLCSLTSLSHLSQLGPCCQASPLKRFWSSHCLSLNSFLVKQTLSCCHELAFNTFDNKEGPHTYSQSVVLTCAGFDSTAFSLLHPFASFLHRWLNFKCSIPSGLFCE